MPAWFRRLLCLPLGLPRASASRPLLPKRLAAASGSALFLFCLLCLFFLLHLLLGASFLLLLLPFSLSFLLLVLLSLLCFLFHLGLLLFLLLLLFFFLLLLLPLLLLLFVLFFLVFLFLFVLFLLAFFVLLLFFLRSLLFLFFLVLLYSSALLEGHDYSRHEIWVVVEICRSHWPRHVPFTERFLEVGIRAPSIVLAIAVLVQEGILFLTRSLETLRLVLVVVV
mmetsp:Transcript_48326/g.113101  ORF Transcript_48326/g.113101 Transcript_48326/m.113101 type:complete len:224 (+) Transcript_48326:634-1305(+)